MTIRPAAVEDRDTAAAWWRGESAFCADALPPIGCVCEDEAGPVGMAWVHLSASVGVGFVEGLVMRPGIGLRIARACGAALMSGLEAAAKALGYGLLVAYALPGCARILRGLGWAVGDPRQKIAMLKTL